MAGRKKKRYSSDFNALEYETDKVHKYLTMFPIPIFNSKKLFL